MNSGESLRKGLIMKTNKMMRLASGLLVAVLLTTCAISGTFAKYVAAGSAGDSARVAKWGVEVTAEGDAFSKAYTDKDSGNTATTTVDGEELATLTVQSSTDKKVVAPGTKGTLVTVGLKGQPEVDVEVAFDAKLTLTGWTVGEKEYCPLVFTVGSKTFAKEDTETVEQFAAKVVEEINGYIERYDTNTDLSKLDESDLPAVRWAWDFETGEGVDAISANDKLDTALGNKAAEAIAAGNEDAAPSIDFEMTVTVTQID